MSEELRNPLLYRDKIFAVAPMMEWTDRHCRFLFRLLSSRTLLYTEMVVAESILRGDRDRLLGYSPEEHPVALQLGGSDPARVGEAARIAVDYGYDEINLNVGCPSDRVRDGTFGACLMRSPGLVGEVVAEMRAVTDLPVTVKCRIGVDDQDPEAALDDVAEAVFAAGADALWVHARKAWLNGLSPAENRTVPPLDYDRVRRLKQAWPDRFIGINGGIASLQDASEHLRSVDGVMLGRAAYHDPMLLADVDAVLFGETGTGIADPFDLVDAYRPYMEERLAEGVRLNHLTRHMLTLFHGRPGARKWRQVLSLESTRRGAGLEVIDAALDAMADAAARTARAQQEYRSPALAES